MFAVHYGENSFRTFGGSGAGLGQGRHGRAGTSLCLSLTEASSGQVFAKMKEDSTKQTKLVRNMEKRLKQGDAERRELKAKSEEASMALIRKVDECSQIERKVRIFALCFPDQS